MKLKPQVQEIKIKSDLVHSKVRIWTQEFETKVREFEEVANRVKTVASSIKLDVADGGLQEIKRKQVIEEGIELKKTNTKTNLRKQI